MNLPPKPPPSSSGPPPPSFTNSASPYPSSSSTGVINPNFRPPPPRPLHGLPQNPLLAQQQQFPQPPPSYGGGNFSYGGLPGGGQANVGAMAAAAALGVLGGGGAQQPRYYQQPPPPQQFSYGYTPPPHQAQGYPYQQQQQNPYSQLSPPPSHPQLNAQGYTISSAFYNPQSQPPPPPQPSYAYPPPSLPSLPSSSNHYSNASASTSQQQQPPAPRPPQPNRRLDTSKISCLPMRNCSLSGCSYTGLYKDVEIHEMDRHLIFPAGWKEKKGKRDGFGGATIEGTSISLQTPEQIAAWVAERKKRWPTKERVEEKAKAREDAIARGEFDPSSSRHGARGGGGGRGGSTRGGSTRGGRGGSRGGGESSTYGARGGAGEPPSKKGRWGAGAEEDQGWKSKGGKPAPVRAPGGNPIEDFDSDPLSSSSNDSDSDSDSDDDDSGSDIDPVKDAVSSRLPPPPPPTHVDGGGPEVEREEEDVEMSGGQRGGGRSCTYFLTPQGCKMGDRCRFVHDESARPVAPILPPTRLPPPPRPAPPPPPSSTNSRPDLLLGLLETDIKHTTSDLSQVIRFLCTNGFLEGVEGRVGELEESERRGVKELGPVQVRSKVGEEGKAEGGMEVDGEGVERGQEGI